MTLKSLFLSLFILLLVPQAFADGIVVMVVHPSSTFDPEQVAKPGMERTLSKLQDLGADIEYLTEDLPYGRYSTNYIAA